jgi:hypothetical protein
MKVSSPSRQAFVLAFALLALESLIVAAAQPAGKHAASQDAATPAEPSGRTTVLNNDSYLRQFMAFRTPVQVSPEGKVTVCLEPVGKDPKPLAEFQSPLPPTDWMKPEFDDSAWERQRAPVEIGPGGATGHSHAARHTATVNSLICLRSKFVVEDPAQVQDLKLSVEYVGGAVVYVNGQELARGNLPAGALAPDTLAEKYPDDLYCEAGGKFLQDIRKNRAGFERRYRRLADVPVPARLLKKRTNVLAIGLYRSAINESAVAAQRVAAPGGMYVVPGIWAHVGLKSLGLSAASGSAVAANIARPKGLQVWNCAPLDTITAFDYGDGGVPQAVAVSSPRNGVFSGRLVISSDAAIQRLTVSVTDLTPSGGGGTIPAAAVNVRCAAPAVVGKSWAPPHRYDALLDAIPAEFPVASAAPPKEYALQGAHEPLLVERKNQVAGALAPLWLAVRVPRDAKPGVYEGTVRVQAAGLDAVAVPLRVTVSAWTVPDPKNFRIHHFAYHSEDAIAKHYGVPLWSDEHLRLMGKSLALMAEVNSRQAIVNLAISFYGGNKGDPNCSNEATAVRWVKQPDGSYKYDCTVLDKYLDLVARSMGKPSLLRINCWGQSKKQDGKLSGGEYAVSVHDPATGKLDAVSQPTPGTEESLQFWKPVLDEVRRKAESRGWWDVTALGWNSYCYPPVPEVVSVARRIWPEGVWSYTAHNGTLGASWATLEKGVTMPVRYADSVWTLGRLTPRGYSQLLKPRPGFWCFTWRSTMRDYSPLALLRGVPEDEIMRGQDGVSDFGADLFPVKSSTGRYYCLGNGRGTGGPSCSTQALLAPGPDGPVGTERFEMLREGTELGEAILFIQQAIEDKKIEGELEQRANRLLEERAEAFLKNWSAGRMARDAQLLALAGEVAIAVGVK